MPRIEQVSFPGSQGGDLAARLDRPAGPPRAYALFTHCFTCTKDVFAASRIAAELADAGIAVLRFDFTGLGASDGEFANTNFSSNTDDLLCAAAWLREHRRAPQLLIGHSLGGAAMLSVAADIPEARAVATIGAPADPTHVLGLLGDTVEKIDSTGHAEVSLAGRSFTIRKQFLDDLRTHPLDQQIMGMRKALLILHSPTDNIVDVEHAARLYRAARHPKSYISLDHADHLLSDHADATYAARMISTWAQRYLTDEHPAAEAPRPSAQVVVTETTQGTFLNHVVAGTHRFLVDEPEAIGGFDAGPSPYDLLAAALGACTSMTLRLYADRKQLALDRVTVEVDHTNVHSADCTDCTDGRDARIDRFERRIHLEGTLTGADQDRLLEIANRCPVHRTLTSPVEIVTALT